MYALVTGASSGIGRDMARFLAELGFDLIITARRTKRLEDLADELKCKVQIIHCDLSDEKSCYELYEKVKNYNIKVLINNAGFGTFGRFEDTNIDDELNLIKTNITAVHILTKLFYRDFCKRNSGYILNVASSAGFAPGPYMATYYASKAYVLRLTQAIGKEAEMHKRNVYISALCPGPVRTEFNTVADVEFSVGSLSSEYVARYAINNLLRKKRVIVPGSIIKIARIASKLVPDSILLEAVSRIQSKKTQNHKIH